MRFRACIMCSLALMLVSCYDVKGEDLIELRLLPVFSENRLIVEGILNDSEQTSGKRKRDRLISMMNSRAASVSVRVENKIDAFDTFTDEQGVFSGSLNCESFQDTISLKLDGRLFHKELCNFPSDAGYLLVSDIDDTVMISDVTNKPLLFYNTIVKSSEDRRAVPGTPELYRNLASGRKRYGAPLPFYLTSSPAALSRYLHGFFKTNDFPHGVLLTKNSLFGSSHEDHKLRWLNRLVELYRRKPFLLFGDSGEKDLKIYYDFAKTRKAEIIAVIIRHVPADTDNLIELNDFRGKYREINVQLIIWNDPAVLRETLSLLDLID